MKYFVRLLTKLWSDGKKNSTNKFRLLCSSCNHSLMDSPTNAVRDGCSSMFMFVPHLVIYLQTHSHKDIQVNFLYGIFFFVHNSVFFLSHTIPLFDTLCFFLLYVNMGATESNNRDCFLCAHFFLGTI